MGNEQEKKEKSLKELNLIDDFLFGEMLTRGEKSEWFVKFMVERILGRKVKSVVFSGDHKVQGVMPGKHGIEMDVLIRVIEEDEPVKHPPVVDIDPNAYSISKRDLVRRLRFYQAMVDSKVLESGEYYKEMPDAYVIFILKNDPFGLGLIQYTLETRCAELDSMNISDGRKNLVLCYCSRRAVHPAAQLRAGTLCF